MVGHTNILRRSTLGLLFSRALPMRSYASRTTGQSVQRQGGHSRASEPSPIPVSPVPRRPMAIPATRDGLPGDEAAIGTNLLNGQYRQLRSVDLHDTVLTIHFAFGGQRGSNAGRPNTNTVTAAAASDRGNLCSA